VQRNHIVPVDEQAVSLIGHVEAPYERPVTVYLGTVSAGSRMTLLASLNTAARLLGTERRDQLVVDRRAPLEVTAFWCPWPELDYETLVTLRRQMEERYTFTSTNKVLSAMRGVLKACWHLHLMEGERYRLTIEVPAARGENLPAGREIKPGEIAALLHVCARDTSLQGRRDAALIATLAGCGLRRAEITPLCISDWNPEERSLTVRGKRNKQRLVYAPDGTFAAVTDWLSARRRLQTTPAEALLFVRMHKGGGLTRYPLGAQGIYTILIERQQEAGIAAFTPHDLRRTFVGDLLDAGADIATVQKLAGHANVATTAKYDRRPEAVKKKAAGLLHIPYQRPYG
jgi:site-specific recombinase XerD